MEHAIKIEDGDPREYQKTAKERGIRVVVKKFFPDLSDSFVVSGPGALKWHKPPGIKIAVRPK